MKSKKIITLATLITILLLITNVYAWFIFNSNANLKIESKIKSWNISFIDGEQEIYDTIEFNIESIYPGMEKEEKKVIIKNNGDVAADIEYKIKSIRVLDENKVVGENCTEQELMDYINSLPFELNIECNQNVLDTLNNTAEVIVSFEWDFEDITESGDITEKDQKDTELGIKAYEYSQQENSEDSNFNIQLKLIAKQRNI